MSSNLEHFFEMCTGFVGNLVEKFVVCFHVESEFLRGIAAECPLTKHAVDDAEPLSLM